MGRKKAAAKPAVTEKAAEPKTEVKPAEQVSFTNRPIEERQDDERKAVDKELMDNHLVSENTDPDRPATEQDSAAERTESVQSHSALVTEGEAAQAHVDGVDLKEQPLAPNDGALLDQKREEPVFDFEKEEALAHAEPEELPEPLKEAQVNPNGLGKEWPRG